MKPTYLFIVVLLGAFTTGCQTTKEDTGRVLGGVIGGILGAQVGKGSGRTAATVAGTIAGVYVGGSIGRSMDDVDRLKMGRTLETNRTNQPTSWNNPDTNRDYTVTPTRTFETAEGPCREFTTEVDIGGRRETAYGTACRQPDGAWKIIN